MLIQKKNVKWGCLPTAFASIIDLPENDLYKIIGHNGGKKVDSKPDPYCRLGIHIQEIVDAFLKLGYAITRIDCSPSLERAAGQCIALFLDDEATDRFIRHLGSSQGVIIGVALNDIYRRHALINDFGLIFDPDTGKQLPCLPFTYSYESYYRVDKIDEAKVS